MAMNKDTQPTISNRPKAGDGTQHEERRSNSVNQIPQAEFINDHNLRSKTKKNEEVPLAPAEIFPFGDPGSQSDG